MDQIWRLKHFLAVAEVGSVQGAARSLHISQPALSKSLRLLEEHLQTALFDRSARGVVLTPMGEAFYRRAREIQSEWDSSLIELSATRDGARGELRIGMGPTYQAVFMRRVLARLARDYPNLRVSVRTGVGALLIPALQAGEISLYAGGLGSYEEYPGEGLQEVFLYNQSNCIVASRDSDLSARDEVAVDDLAKHPWVMLSYDSIAIERIGRLFRSAGLAPPQSTVSTQSLNLAIELVRKDGFLTSLPRPLVHPNINPEVCPLYVSTYDWTIRSGVTYRSSMRSLEPVKAILEMLKQDVAQLGFA
ncbi:LysR family transcriptional regulator [Chelativorans sp. AA-79]|uniref:LysR family transcriptional regulator n=1 Tax=Chelativorans sp. AA-79 TaxID=3028735 RepID=UPI0023F85B13|nr:LysR family transcriptional regulator [Chelativorans sp. AA-79]WEX12173.1 LysR family transcriptional regulator [Chelativorans sp. AA-79]